MTTEEKKEFIRKTKFKMVIESFSGAYFFVTKKDVLRTANTKFWNDCVIEEKGDLLFISQKT
jgi:hypothetical protein